MSDAQSEPGGFEISTTPTDEQLRHPIDNVIAVVDTRARLLETARELTESGFLAAEIGALTGPATDERKRIAERILAANGARFIHYFNRFTIERVRP